MFLSEVRKRRVAYITGIILRPKKQLIVCVNSRVSQYKSQGGIMFLPFRQPYSGYTGMQQESATIQQTQV